QHRFAVAFRIADVADEARKARIQHQDAEGHGILICIPGAAQHEMMRCSPGIAKNAGPSCGPAPAGRRTARPAIWGEALRAAPRAGHGYIFLYASTIAWPSAPAFFSQSAVSCSPTFLK